MHKTQKNLSPEYKHLLNSYFHIYWVLGALVLHCLPSKKYEHFMINVNLHNILMWMISESGALSFYLS